MSKTRIVQNWAQIPNLTKVSADTCVVVANDKSPVITVGMGFEPFDLTGRSCYFPGNPREVIFDKTYVGHRVFSGALRFTKVKNLRSNGDYRGVVL